MIELAALATGLTPNGTGPDAEHLTPTRLSAVHRYQPRPGTLRRHPAPLQYVGMKIGPTGCSEENRSEA